MVRVRMAAAPLSVAACARLGRALLAADDAADPSARARPHPNRRARKKRARSDRRGRSRKRLAGGLMKSPLAATPEEDSNRSHVAVDVFAQQVDSHLLAVGFMSVEVADGDETTQ